jgi:hypothetical protein
MVCSEWNQPFQGQRKQAWSSEVYGILAAPPFKIGDPNLYHPVFHGIMYCYMLLDSFSLSWFVVHIVFSVLRAVRLTAKVSASDSRQQSRAGKRAEGTREAGEASRL